VKAAAEPPAHSGDRTPDAFGLTLRSAITSSVVRSEDDTAHGLRAGLVTEAARRGADTQMIMRRTRHRNVNQVSEYIRHDNVFVATVDRILED
jgi:integrase